MNQIKLGTYRHFKGYMYEVLGMAKHSETQEDMVIYKALYGDCGTWVRPLTMWEDTVTTDGKTVKRFERIEEEAIREQCITSAKMIVYFDMDNVLVDFKSGIAKLSPEVAKEYKGRLDEVPGIFSLMSPMPGALEAVKAIAAKYDVYILSTSPWKNPTALKDKLDWVKKYFGEGKDSVFYKRLIFSHHKDLNKGAYLIDDRTKNGASEFEGELIQFGSEAFPDWDSVTSYLISK
jgi:5'(3')-deoxyribonucleotidase